MAAGKLIAAKLAGALEGEVTPVLGAALGTALPAGAALGVDGVGVVALPEHAPTAASATVRTNEMATDLNAWLM